MLGELSCREESSVVFSSKLLHALFEDILRRQSFLCVWGDTQPNVDSLQHRQRQRLWLSVLTGDIVHCIHRSLVISLREQVPRRFRHLENEDADEGEGKGKPAEGDEGISPAHIIGTRTGVWRRIRWATEIGEEYPCKQ